MASFPNRCQHIKVNGTQCGSPALRRHRFCFFHKRFQDERIRLAGDRARRAAPVFLLPVLEDANSIQIALMQVMRLILSRQIEHKTASLLLYALQTASANLRAAKFDPNRHDVILDPRDAAITPLAYRAWEDSEFEDEEEEDDDKATVEAKSAPPRKETRTASQIEADLRRAREASIDRSTPPWWQSGAKPPVPPNQLVASVIDSKSSNAAASADVSSSVPTQARKPPAATGVEKVRQEIRDLIQNSFPEGFPNPATKDKNGTPG